MHIVVLPAEEKLRWLLHAPYICIGAFYSVQGGSLSHAKALLRKGLDEYDRAIAANKLRRMHGVSHRLLCSWFYRPQRDCKVCGPDVGGPVFAIPSSTHSVSYTLLTRPTTYPV